MAFLLKRRRTVHDIDAERLCRDFERQLAEATRSRLDRIDEAVTRLEPGWDDTVARDTAFLRHAGAARRALRELTTARTHTPHSADSLRFQVSTRFLRDCWTYLISDPSGDELMHLVTGPITADGLRILAQMERITFAEKSPGYVAANRGDTHRRVIALEADGHPLLAMFHSHIMHGRESTEPSTIDLANQDRFLNIGWDAIGGIFTLDGWVRLFGTGKPITVDVYGKSATVVERGTHHALIKLDT